MTDWQHWKGLPRFKDLPTTYAELVAMYPPRSIRNDSQRAKATAVVDAMAGHVLNRDQDDYLDLISTLLSQYEEEHFPVRARKLAPVEALRYLLEQSGMTTVELGRLLGNAELGPKVLRGERELSVNQIAILAGRFAVSPELFVPKPVAARVRAKSTRRSPASWRARARMRH